jgi:hypothetical protein
MSIFASKAAFAELGLETVNPSGAHMYQDCYICKNPLDIDIHTTSTDKHHAAVRIGMCGHLHGQECLSAWLDVGNSCPTCRQLLFENSGRGVSQSDINYVVNYMKRRFGVYGEKIAVAAVARIVDKQEAEKAQQQRIREEEEVKKLKAREAQAQHGNPLDDDDDNDWMNDSDVEEDFGEEEDGDFEMRMRMRMRMTAAFARWRGRAATGEGLGGCFS